MKLKKNLIILTFAISVVDIVIITYINTGFLKSEFVYDLSLAIIGSVILGFLYSVIEYNDSKRQALDKLDKLAWEVKIGLDRIKHFTPSEPIELLIKLFNEESINKIRKIAEIESEDEAKCEFISYLKDDGQINDYIIDNFKDMFEGYYSYKIDEYRNEVEDIMEIYISLSKFRVDNVIEAFNSLSFVFGFSKHKFIKEEIFQPILTIMNKIKVSAFHFEQYFSTKDRNLAPSLKMLKEIQEVLFEIDVTYDDHIKTTTILTKFISKLEANIIHLKNFSIFNKEPKYEYNIKSVNQKRVDL